MVLFDEEQPCLDRFLHIIFGEDCDSHLYQKYDDLNLNETIVASCRGSEDFLGMLYEVHACNWSQAGCEIFVHCQGQQYR